MRRLSIEVTPEQHQRLKAIAALHGKSIKDYVLERALPPLPDHEDLTETEALHQLEAFLKPRLDAAEQGHVIEKSVEQIVEEVSREPQS